MDWDSASYIYDNADGDMVFGNMEDIDKLVAAELEKAGFRDHVNEKFKEMNDRMDEKVTSVMKSTQKIFDCILEDMNKLEAEEKLLSRELHQLRDADIIVLDDDDDNVDVVKQESSSSKILKGESLIKPDTDQLASSSTAWNQEYSKPARDSMGLCLGLRVLAKKRTQWFPASIIDIVKQDEKTKYKVRYDMYRGKSKVQANHLACIDTSRRFSPGQIPAGSRIAAHFKDEGIYSGIVAEAPDRKLNKNRFLVFFDDGYAMYCHIDVVFLVYGPPANVWDDISCRLTAEYVQKYLSTSERPMLTMRVNQILKVEFRGEWHKARCVKVDCSLVEVVYLHDNTREWIYRGCLRLEPLYKQSHMKMRALQNKTPRRLARAHTGVRNAHIEYATIDLTRDSSPSPSNSPTRDQCRRLSDMDDRKKNVAKKSTGGLSKQQSMIESVTAQINVSPSYKGWEGEWKAPWSRSLAAQKPQAGHSPVTRLPQSFSEIKGGVDVASHILDRMAFRNKQMNQKKTWRAGTNGREDKRNKSSDGVREDDDIDEYGDKADARLETNRKRMVFGARAQSYYLFAPKRSAGYVKHVCGPKCIEPFRVGDVTKLAGTNPLMKPLLLGWTREGSRMQPYSKGPAFHAYYRAPCGRMCRNMSDVERYMLETSLTDLDYDQFCFDFSVRTHSNTVVHPRDTKFFMEDYSDGKEDIPISCVNEITCERPPVMPYTKKRVPGENVHINTSSDFMVCCDCPDNCRDRSACPCQQLTVNATSCSRGGKIKEDAGYSYKRLFGFLPTGIYECNPKCKCNNGCPNRVVQKGLQCRLQMFKTHKKGWGIRCLDDIARGTFVCVYTGKIQTEAKANAEGLLHGDEYLAELDHIEVAERQKDVEDDGASSSGVDCDMDEEEDEEEENRDEQNKAMTTQRCDSEGNTTDSEAESKHVTVTLKRDPDSKWMVKGNESTGCLLEEKRPGKNIPEFASKKAQSESNGRQSGGHKGARKTQNIRLEHNDTSDSDGEAMSAYYSTLVPPSRPNGNGEEDDDEVTTDTDSECSNNGHSRPSSACDSLTSGKNHSERRSASQSIGLHSSKVKAESDSEDEEKISQTRRFFGSKDTFIIDAKQTGNLGRYLNHSCTPNLLVQNVFIDTQDLRFPWVAFFATSTIRAGTELTWDYNYEIGSVEGREIPCYCGATKCRKRLL